MSNVYERIARLFLGRVPQHIRVEEQLGFTLMRAWVAVERAEVPPEIQEARAAGIRMVADGLVERKLIGRGLVEIALRPTERKGKGHVH